MLGHRIRKAAPLGLLVLSLAMPAHANEPLGEPASPPQDLSAKFSAFASGFDQDKTGVSCLRTPGAPDGANCVVLLRCSVVGVSLKNGQVGEIAISFGGDHVADDARCTTAQYLSQISRALELFADIGHERAQEITHSMEQNSGAIAECDAGAKPAAFNEGSGAMSNGPDVSHGRRTQKMFCWNVKRD